MIPLLDQPGVSMRPIKVSGHLSSGTTYIELDDVRVPVENLVGDEGMGMKYIMMNFNHERLTIAIGVVRAARVALAAAFEYCLKREAFGKTLMDQPVVRHRLAKCGAMLESQWAWVEQFVYQMTKLKKAEADVELGGLTALAKAQAGIVLDECARCAVLLFGGSGFTTTGQGEIAESMSIHIVIYLTRITDRMKGFTGMFQALAFQEALKMSCWIWLSGNLSRTTRTRLNYLIGLETAPNYSMFCLNTGCYQGNVVGSEAAASQLLRGPHT